MHGTVTRSNSFAEFCVVRWTLPLIAVLCRRGTATAAMEAEAASGEAALGVSEELLPSAALCSLLEHGPWRSVLVLLVGPNCAGAEAELAARVAHGRAPIAAAAALVEHQRAMLLDQLGDEREGGGRDVDTGLVDTGLVGTGRVDTGRVGTGLVGARLGGGGLALGGHVRRPDKSRCAAAGSPGGVGGSGEPATPREVEPAAQDAGRAHRGSRASGGRSSGPRSRSEEAHGLRVIADEQVLRLLVVLEHHLVRLAPDARLEPRYDADLLGGAVVLEGEGYEAAADGFEGGLYRTAPPALKPKPFRAIPYHLWANRDAGAMQVWLAEK